jgi:hypothetical protein
MPPVNLRCRLGVAELADALDSKSTILLGGVCNQRFLYAKFGRLWYAGPNAAANAIGYAQFILLSWFGIPCVLAISPPPRLRCARAMEEGAETL